MTVETQGYAIVEAIVAVVCGLDNMMALDLEASKAVANTTVPGRFDQCINTDGFGKSH
jgi:hypothetical protein